MLAARERNGNKPERLISDKIADDEVSHASLTIDSWSAVEVGELIEQNTKALSVFRSFLIGFPAKVHKNSHHIEFSLVNSLVQCHIFRTFALLESTVNPL